MTPPRRTATPWSRFSLMFLPVAVALCLPWHAVAMPEEQLQQVYLEVVENAVETFEPLWTDDSDRVPDSGYFDFLQYGNWKDPGYAGIITVPGNGMIILCYALLLTQTDKETFTDQQVPRDILLDHALKALRWISLTSAHAETPYPFVPYGVGAYMKGTQWIRPAGLRVDMQGWLTVGAALLWDRLDPELKRLIEPALVGEAMVEYRPFTWAPREGGLHDCVKHYLSSLLAAAFLFPQREEETRAMELVRQSGIDLVATWHDRANSTQVDGKPVRDWVKSWNLYQDYSSDHHAHAQIWYGCDLIFEGRTYVELLSHLTGLPVPETYTYQGNGFDGVLEWAKRIASPHSEPIPVHGAEYDSYYGAGLLAFCYGAVIKKDPIAAALEEQAARLLERQSRAVRQYDYHRNSWAKAAAAYLMHRYCGPRAEPLPLDEALAGLEGVYHHPSQLNLVHRAPDKWVSWSWGILPGRHVDGHCGLVIPAGPNEPEKDPLVYAHANTMVGRIRGDWLATPKGQHPAPTYTHVMKDNGFCTAGVREAPALDQYRALFSFDEGPCVLFTRFKAHKAGTFTWTGLPIYFYARDGMTGPRTLYDAEGSCTLGEPVQHQSTWWCVDDRIGLVVVGGNRALKAERVPGLNWARIPAYRDQCDVVRVTSVENRPTKAGELPVDVCVAIFTNAGHGQVARVAETMQGAQLPLPAGWQGLVVPDATRAGKRYLALANFHGPETQAVLELSFPEGAPILEQETRVEGSSGRATLECAPRGSAGQVVELYATVIEGHSVVARKQTPARYVLRSPDGPAKVRLAYTGRGAPPLRVSALSGGGTPATVALSETQMGGATLMTATLTIDRPTVVQLESKANEDRTGPAVEIANIDMLADGRVSVTVSAGDQSGIERVGLFMDSQPVSDKTHAPCTWTLWPGGGFHTFYAAATDASPGRNTRQSFRRTVEVRPGEPPF